MSQPWIHRLALKRQNTQRHSRALVGPEPSSFGLGKGGEFIEG